MWLSEVKPEAVKGRGRGKGAQSDRHMDRQDTDTAQGEGTHTDPHMQALPGSNTWKTLGVQAGG